MDNKESVKGLIKIELIKLLLIIIIHGLGCVVVYLALSSIADGFNNEYAHNNQTIILLIYIFQGVLVFVPACATLACIIKLVKISALKRVEPMECVVVGKLSILSNDKKSLDDRPFVQNVRTKRYYFVLSKLGLVERGAPMGEIVYLFAAHPINANVRIDDATKTIQINGKYIDYMSAKEAGLISKLECTEYVDGMIVRNKEDERRTYKSNDE